MEIHLPADQQALVEGLISSGRFPSANEVIVAGVQLLAATEKLRTKVQVGIEQADRNEVVEHETVFNRLKAMAMAAQDGN